MTTRQNAARPARRRWYNPLVLKVLASPAHRLLDRSLVVLRVRGRVSGTWFELPTMYAEDGAGLVVVPGDWERKHWWRNLLRPARLQVRLRGEWRDAEGVVVRPGEPGYAEAVAAYRRRWRRASLPEQQPAVRISLL
jgi:hypothetical protein